MKNLIFLDNDSKSDDLHEMGLHHTQRMLFRAGFDRDYVSNIRVIDNFSSMPQAEKLPLLFNPQNIIVTYSSFTANHENSLGQLREFLRAAGSNNVKGVTYINTSSFLAKAAEDLFREDRGAYDMMQAFATNTIIDTDEGGKVAQLIIDLKGRHESPFKRVEINVAELVKDTEIVDLRLTERKRK